MLPVCFRLSFLASTLLVVLSAASARADPPREGARDPGRTWRRAALVETGLGLVLAGSGTALVVTQPEGSFARGLGGGLIAWGGLSVVQAILDGIDMRRVRHGNRAMGSRSLAAARWNVALSSLVLAIGVAMVTATEVRHRNGAEDANLAHAGFGTTYVVFGTTLLALGAWQLAREKRRNVCLEACPRPRGMNGLALRF
jgi:hypothetical protein